MHNSGIGARNEAGVSWPKNDDHEQDAAAALGSISRHGQWAQWQQRRHLASRVRSCLGAAGRTEMLRVRDKATGQPSRNARSDRTKERPSKSDDLSLQVTLVAGANNPLNLEFACAVA